MPELRPQNTGKDKGPNHKGSEGKIMPEYSAEIRIFFSSEEEAEIALKAVSLELGQEFERNSKSSAGVEGSSVLLKVVAENATALKASVNSYLKLIGLTYDILGGNSYG